MTSNERRAVKGELCTCGRQAVTVFRTELHGEIGWCGVSNVPQVSPCPWCSGDHGGKCAHYSISTH
ncbi:hypothetical protein C8D87_104178 [Lentzea atacamensis]|uniref:Uncharacterized protein n=1 Tax=Lentzea atacamensis TaxID=531938 RepID=A0ABX9E991_9PSEU|nr:hypothetical protein C8D87_104178 [Lentzea atacamensis]